MVLQAEPASWCANCASTVVSTLQCLPAAAHTEMLPVAAAGFLLAIIVSMSWPQPGAAVAHWMVRFLSAKNMGRLGRRGMYRCDACFICSAPRTVNHSSHNLPQQISSRHLGTLILSCLSAALRVCTAGKRLEDCDHHKHGSHLLHLWADDRHL